MQYFVLYRSLRSYNGIHRIQMAKKPPPQRADSLVLASRVWNRIQLAEGKPKSIQVIVVRGEVFILPGYLKGRAHIWKRIIVETITSEGVCGERGP